jgi:hypothetical protein
MLLSFLIGCLAPALGVFMVRLFLSHRLLKNLLTELYCYNLWCDERLKISLNEVPSLWRVIWRGL